MKDRLSTAVRAFALMVALTALALSAEGRRVGTASTATSPRSAALLYSRNCSSCHGKDGQSKTFKAKFNHARNLTDPDWQGSVSDERIFNSIANGRGKMPPLHKKMSDAEIDSLVLYVRGLKK